MWMGGLQRGVVHEEVLDSQTGIAVGTRSAARTEARKTGSREEERVVEV